MSLPNVRIKLGNGNLGRVRLSDDGVAGLLVPGKAVSDKLELNRHYKLASLRDLQNLGVTAENNPLVYKDVVAFYTSAGEGAELHLVVTEENKTLADMSAVTPASPLRKLIDGGAGRIRLVGVNHPGERTPTITQGISDNTIAAVAAAQSVAGSYTSQVCPVRILLPALNWDGTTENLYKPREASSNRIGLVLAADQKIDGKASAAIGQILGRAASIAVHRSIARVRDGAIAVNGFMMDGKTPEDHFADLAGLDEAGYIIYRTYAAKNGYYINDDPMCAPITDDYSNLYLGRVIDKASIIAYTTYIESIMDNVVVDEEGKIPDGHCKAYEQMFTRAVGAQMADEISSFDVYVNPDQDVLTTGVMDVDCKIVPQGILREINVNLSFSNPQNN